MIDKFDGDYAFLSNFYPCKIMYDGIIYSNNEAAFQAQKTLDLNIRKEFSELNPSQAKRKGRKLKLRPDWEQVKYTVMYNACYLKFHNNLKMRDLLISTAPHELVEGNTWGDRYWGKVNGVGENNLGKILMDIRDHILVEQLQSDDYLY